MMKTYNSFSFSRVGLLVKRDVVENWKKFLFLIFILSLIFLYAMFLKSGTPFEATGGYEIFSSYILDNCITIFTYYSIFLCSGVMANMRMQEERTNFLMLPAGNLEKFLARLLYVAFLVFVPFVVGFLLADVLHMLLFPLLVDSEVVRTLPLLPGMWDAKSEAVPWILDVLKPLNLKIAPSFVYALTVFSFVESVWEASCYILGGCYWRKYPFVKTIALLMLFKSVVMVLLGVSYVNIVREVEAPVEASKIWMDKFFMGFSQDSLLFICVGVCFVWAILNFYLAYRFFRRSQIV